MTRTVGDIIEQYRHSGGDPSEDEYKLIEHIEHLKEELALRDDLLKKWQEKNHKLKEGVEEFLSHAMEFTCDARMNYLIECPSCGAHQGAELSSPLKHSTHCPIVKLQKLVESKRDS